MPPRIKETKQGERTVVLCVFVCCFFFTLALENSFSQNTEPTQGTNVGRQLEIKPNKPKANKEVV